MASASEVGSGNRCAATSSPGVPAGAKARSRSRRRLARVTARPRAVDLRGQCRDQPMEHEAERLEVLHGRLDRDGEGEAFGGPARAERIGLLAVGPGVDAGAFRPEPGDERGRRQVRHGADPAQTEARQPGPDVRVGGQQPCRTGREERRLATGRDEDRDAGAGVDGRDRGGEPGPGRPDLRATARTRPSDAGRTRRGPPTNGRRGPVRRPTAARGRPPGPRTGRTPGRAARCCRRDRG